MSVPNVFPLLSKGSHDGPEQGGCLMEVVSFLTGEAWSDQPLCVDLELAYIGQEVNDYVDDEHRQLLLNYVNRFIGTADLPVTLSRAIFYLENPDGKYDEIIHRYIEIRNLTQARQNAANEFFETNDRETLDEEIRYLSGKYLEALDGLLSALEAANATYATPIQPDQLKQVQELLA